MTELDATTWTREDCAELANRAQVSIDEAQRAVLECIGRLVVDGQDGSDDDYRRAHETHRLLDAATRELDALVS
jgi:hypothetical protein